jgi:hypothetical protein
MTAKQLKKLKTGINLQYIELIDNVNEFYKVESIDNTRIHLVNIEESKDDWFIFFNEPYIENIASCLYFVRKSTNDLERELRLIEVKIRDVEFDLTQLNVIINACLIAKEYNEYQPRIESAEELRLELKDLRNKRNQLIENI